LRSYSPNPLISNLLLPSVALLLAFGYQTPQARAHGALIEVTQKTVEIKATFDNGDPMAAAQVLIYSPTDLETPWEKGQTDSEGRFTFTPEERAPGQWEVTVRQAGHGGTTTFAVGESTTGATTTEHAASTAASTSTASTNGAPLTASTQKWVSIAAVIWGFVGTALFFSRKPSGGKA